MQKGVVASAGTKMLEHFVAPFDAEVVTRLAENNIPVSGRVALGPFGMGSDAPLPDGMVLCNDLFGKTSRQAAKQGLCALRPTYGTVSRYGLIPAACSMDQIGVICQNPEDGWQFLSLIAGKDDKDGAMLPHQSYVYQKADKPPRIADASLALPYADVYDAVMLILSSAEISNNISRYDGIKFGHRTANYTGLHDLYVNTRTEAFDQQTKQMAVMGALVLSQDYYVPYYEKAMKIRRLIKASLPFDQYDVLTLPVDSPLAQLAGLPSLTVGTVQLVADALNETALHAAWEVLFA